MTERELLLAVITHPAGFEVDLFAILMLRPLESGEFAVGWDYPEHPNLDGSVRPHEEWEQVFDKPEEAVDRFIEVRNKQGLGYDHETDDVDAYNAGYSRGLNTEYHNTVLATLFGEWKAETPHLPPAPSFDAFVAGYRAGRADYTDGTEEPTVEDR